MDYGTIVELRNSHTHTYRIQFHCTIFSLFLCYGKFKILHCQRATIQMRIDMQQPLVGPKAIKSPP